RIWRDAPEARETMVAHFSGMGATTSGTGTPIPTALSLPVRDSTTLTMRGTPDRADTDVPGALVKLSNLPNVRPAPVLAHFDLVSRSHFDPFAIDLQHGLASWVDAPVANPFPPA